jgi:hypothetical protein
VRRAYSQTLRQVIDMDLSVTTIVEALRAIHREAAELLDGVDARDLHRSPPVSQTNSVAVLIHHAVNAEMQIVREVVGLPAPRDREAEFHITADAVDADQLRAELDAADRLLTEVAPTIRAEQLQAHIERAGGRVFTGLRWLITAYAHFAEHIGQAQITQQWVTSSDAAARRKT